MQLILLLLLIIGVAVVMTASFAGISYAWDCISTAATGRSLLRPERSPCAQCNADRDWYLSLPYWQQCVISAWWWANRLRWAAKGCK